MSTPDICIAVGTNAAPSPGLHFPEPIQLPAANKMGIAHAISGPSPSCVSFTAVVTLTVEEYNRIQGEIERLQKLADDRAVQIIDLKAKAAPSFNELWDRILKSPDLAVDFGAQGERSIWFVPAGVREVPEFRVKPALRSLLAWPEHHCDMITNLKRAYNQNLPVGHLYSKLTALAAANSQPK